MNYLAGKYQMSIFELINRLMVILDIMMTSFLHGMARKMNFKDL